MAEGKSFVIGIVGILASLFFVVMGWMPEWVLFGVLIIASVLYETKFFATGIVGGFSVSVFTSIGWLPAWVYFTSVVIATVMLSVKMADKYINTGIGGK
jgi:hypothetical protein